MENYNPINLEAHFERLSHDWDAYPVEPIWLPKKSGLFRVRNMQAHAFTAISTYGGRAYSSIAMCGWNTEKSVYTSEYVDNIPENNVCQICLKMYDTYMERLKTFKHTKEADNTRSEVAKAGFLFK